MEPGSLAGLLNLETGLLPPEETAVLEHLYGTAQEKLTAAPDITEVDEDQSDDITLILSALREVEGQACYQAFLFSSPEPLGLYDFQIRMTPLTEDADTVDVVSTLHEKACALYGDPSTDPGLSSISDRLEDPIAEGSSFSETWTAGGPDQLHNPADAGKRHVCHCHFLPFNHGHLGRAGLRPPTDEKTGCAGRERTLPSGAACFVHLF